MEDSPLLKQLQPQQQLAVSLYMKCMNKNQAAQEAGYGSPHVFSTKPVKAAIAEQMSIRAERLRVGADWVLGQAVKVYHRCMQMELVTVVDNDGLPEGRYQFDARGAIQALTLIGKHVDVQAFQPPVEGTFSDQDVMQRLLRGRQRRAELSVDSDDLLDSDAEPTPPVSFLVPLTAPVESEPPDEQLSAPDEQFAEPADYEYTEAVHEIDDLLEPTPEEKLKLLMERWRTGKPPC